MSTSGRSVRRSVGTSVRRLVGWLVAGSRSREDRRRRRTRDGGCDRRDGSCVFWVLGSGFWVLVSGLCQCFSYSVFQFPYSVFQILLLQVTNFLLSHSNLTYPSLSFPILKLLSTSLTFLHVVLVVVMHM